MKTIGTKVQETVILRRIKIEGMYRHWTYGQGQPTVQDFEATDSLVAAGKIVYNQDAKWYVAAKQAEALFAPGTRVEVKSNWGWGTVVSGNDNEVVVSFDAGGSAAVATDKIYSSAAAV